MLWHSFERRGYWFVLKATMVFPLLRVNINPIFRGSFSLYSGSLHGKLGVTSVQYLLTEYLIKGAKFKTTNLIGR